MSQTASLLSMGVLQFFSINTRLHFEILVVGMFGDFLSCMKRLEGLDNANTNDLNFMWLDELHSTLPNPGQRMCISDVALLWQTPHKCQQKRTGGPLYKITDGVFSQFQMFRRGA